MFSAPASIAATSSRSEKTARERLRARFARVLAGVCRRWREQGEAARALALYEKCAEIDPMAARQGAFNASVTNP